MSNAAPTESLPQGTTLHEGALVVQDVLSQSHFAITYRGRDTRLAREVAIKEYFPLGCVRDGLEVQPRATVAAEFERAKNQFLAEARVLAQFRHPGIVAVFDFFAENNTTYMVMEFLAGSTLEAVLENGHLSVGAAVSYALKIGEALQNVHDAALLHCDIKPENVMVCPLQTHHEQDERVVLVDFGLTKRLDESQSYNTRRLNDSGHFGTPGYAPIEQYTHSAQIGAYTDVYALGATLYRLLTGAVPASAADRAAGAEWIPPDKLNSQVSRSLSEVVVWAMEMTPAARAPTVAIWMERLRAVEEQERLRSTLLRVLSARLQYLSMYPETTQTASPAHSTLDKSTLPPVAARAATADTEYMTDDTGCLHACFVGCLVAWFIGAALTFAAWAIRFVLVGG